MPAGWMDSLIDGWLVGWNLYYNYSGYVLRDDVKAWLSVFLEFFPYDPYDRT